MVKSTHVASHVFESSVIQLPNGLSPVAPNLLERYNIVSLKNIQDAGAKLDAWCRQRRSKSA
jgi:hypothetical protein